MCHKYVDILSDVIYIKGIIRRVFELISGMNDPNGAINEQETKKKRALMPCTGPHRYVVDR